MSDEAAREYRALCLRIAALSRQLQSRKRDDVARRPEIAAAIAEAKQQRAALAVSDAA